jgi:hypothetical protein
MLKQHFRIDTSRLQILALQFKTAGCKEHPEGGYEVGTGQSVECRR